MRRRENAEKGTRLSREKAEKGTRGRRDEDEEGGRVVALHFMAGGVWFVVASMAWQMIESTWSS